MVNGNSHPVSDALGLWGVTMGRKMLTVPPDDPVLKQFLIDIADYFHFRYEEIPKYKMVLNVFDFCDLPMPLLMQHREMSAPIKFRIGGTFDSPKWTYMFVMPLFEHLDIEIIGITRITIAPGHVIVYPAPMWVIIHNEAPPFVLSVWI